MMVLLILFIAQSLIAVAVVFVLRSLLIRELEKAAVEKLSSLKISQNVDHITVYYAQVVSPMIQEEIKAISHRKFSKVKIVFEQLQALKGGLIIKIADDILDFSLSSRLEHLWS